MTFKPQISQVETKHNRKIDEVKSQNTITLNANGEKIEKVLFTRALPAITSVNVGNGNVTMEGTVYATSLVVTESGVNSLTGQSVFNISYNSTAVQEGAQVFAITKNQGIENIAVNDLTISFTSVFSVEISMVEKEKLTYVNTIAPANEKVDTLKYTTICCAKNENFDITTEIDLPNSISKVLLAESCGVLKDCSSSVDLVTLNGEIYTNLVYLTNDENPKLKSQLYTTDFHQEVLTTGVKPENKCVASLSVVSNEFEVQGELTSSKGVLVLKNKFTSNVFVVEEQTAEIVVDAFCPKKEMQLSLQSYINQRVVCSKVVSDKIDGNVVLTDEEIRIDKVVISSCGMATVKKTQIIDNDVIVSGTAFVNVAYLLDEENAKPMAIQVEIPFETNVRCDELKTTDHVIANVEVKETEARNKKSKEIDVLAELVVCVTVVRNEDEAILSDIVVGENRSVPDANMGLYMVDSAAECWDVAKALLISPATLMEQNPTLTFPITKPTQIVVYRQQRFN